MKQTMKQTALIYSLPARESLPFFKDVINGLSKDEKTIPCKYFYDARGSELFEAISNLPEYYLTRTEINIMQKSMHDIAGTIGADADIIEFGTGYGIKSSMLLAGIESPRSYSPIDISQTALLNTTKQIKRQFPNLKVTPFCIDYTDYDSIEKTATGNNTTIFFSGSSFGNLEKDDAIALLSRAGMITKNKGGILIGIDLMKNTSQILSAYNDEMGINAEFNKNLLLRVNRELDGDFDIDAFSHSAVLNRDRSRIEMHLVSNKAQNIKVGGIKFSLNKGETIHTENSYKYTIFGLQHIAALAGLNISKSWIDTGNMYSMHYLQAQKWQY